VVYRLEIPITTLYKIFLLLEIPWIMGRSPAHSLPKLPLLGEA